MSRGFRIRRTLGLAAALLALAASEAALCRAESVQVRFTGEVTDVTDTLGLFNNTFAVGSPVTGKYAYTPSGMFELPGATPVSTVYVTAGGSRNLSVNLGTVALESIPSPFLRLRITNDDPVIGDQYLVGGNTDYPSAFTLLDDPLLTFPDLVLTLTDPTSSAFPSLALPLSTPTATAYATHIGTVTISNADTDEILAQAVFSVDTIAAIPEPATATHCLIGIVALGALNRRVRLLNGIAHA
jgi:hypothetical protein